MMSALRKFLPGKKKNKKSTSSSIKSAVSEQNIACVNQVPGNKDVKEKDLPKLHKAAWHGDMAKLKQLLKKTDVNAMDKHHRTPLHYACMKGNNEITQWLCANRANLGICDEDGKAALMKAVEAASETCVETLLNHGAEANIVDVNLATPLHIAATHGSIRMATLLLEHGARVNASDTEKITPLYLAASFNFTGLLEFLLKEYASVNEADIYGRTPLIAAAMEGNDSVIKILLDYGADAELKDKEGWKAIDHAEMTGNHSISDILQQHDHEQETVPPEQPPANTNFGSGIGSPFRSTSTQPSTYGGPALNITADSEDDSVGNESPQRPDFQNSWADSDSDFDGDDLKNKTKGPNLASSLKHAESTQSRTSLSKIPIVTSQEAVTKKDDAERSVEKSPSKLESKIPRFGGGGGGGGSKGNAKTSSKEDISSPPLAQPASKIPRAAVGKGSPTHEAMKDDLKLKHGDSESRIPRLSGLSMSRGPAERPDIHLNGRAEESKSGEMETKDSRKKQSFEWDNALASSFDSDQNEDVSEADILAALTGTPNKKVEKNRAKSTTEDHKAKTVAASTSMDARDSAPESTSEALGDAKDNQNEDREEYLGDGDVEGSKLKSSDSEWDSTEEELSAPKPNLRELMKKEKETGDFDLDVNFDSSIEETEASSPELKGKLTKAEGDAGVGTEEEDKSLHSDLSLNEGEVNVKAKISEGAKKEGNNLEGNEDQGTKSTKGIRAQLEALGIEAGSSLDSSSEDESVGKFSASFTSHDDIFASKDAVLVEKETAKSRKPGFESEDKQHSTEKDPENATKTSGNSLRSEEGKRVATDDKEKSKSAKVQYAALGIDLSDESSMESESEWEASLKAKKVTENAGYDDARNIGLDKEKINEKSQENAEHSKDDIGQSGSEREKLQRNDSEFISDESFSVNTEEQLEELEEIRLKKADEDENPPSDFDDSDFSFSESSKMSKPMDGGATKLKNEDEFDSEAGDDEEEEANSRSEVPVEESEEEEEELEHMVIKEDYVPKKQEDFDSEFDEDQSKPTLNMETSSSESSPNREVIGNEVDEYGVKTKGIEATDETKIDEKAKFFQNIVNNRSSRIEIPNDTRLSDEVATDTANVEKNRQLSDAERKRSLEAMLSPVESVVVQNTEPESIVKPVFMEKAESEVEGKELSGIQGEENNAGFEHVPPVEHESSGELSEIEEEFEKRLKEKELESRRSPRGGVEEIRGISLEEVVSRKDEMLEETVDEQVLESWQQHEEQEKVAEMDFEGERLRYNMELKLKKHQEELRQKERDFEIELRRTEAEEKERRQRLIEERERERRKLEEMQKKQREEVEHEIAERERKRKELEEKQRQERKEMEERERAKREKERKELEEAERKKAEEEVKKLEKEKEMWENKKGKFKDQRGRMELEEAAKRRKKEEIAAAESSRRLKEQEDLLRKIKENKTSHRDDSDDADADSKRNELEELAIIEQFLREHEKVEKRRISKSVSSEDVIEGVQSNATSAARNVLQEDYISPVNRANQLIENEIWLEPLETRLPEQAPVKRASLNKSEDSGKMKQESELLLQSAVNRTNELLRGEKTGTRGSTQGNVGISPRQKHMISDDLSDYGSADVDDIIKVSSFAHQRDDIDPIIHTPGSDAVDTGVVNYQPTADYPISSTPFGRYDSHGVGYADTISPIKRPKSAPYTMSENEVSPVKPASPMALYTSLSQSGHFQDSKALMKMQDALKESKREGERMKEKNIILETMKKEMETDLREMQRTVEVLSRSQTDFEKLRLDMEMEMREIKFRLDNEIQSRIAAEGLVSQLKDQIKRGDGKLTGEVEARQAVELAYKTLESEFRKRDTLINQFENEVNDLRFALYHEREARVNQEKLYKDQLKQHELLLEETQKTSLQHAQALNQLEVTDQNRQSAESNVNQLKIDLAKTNSELTRVNAQLEDVKSTYENEVARVRNKLQDTMDELVKSEREQFQAQMHMEAEKSTAKAEQLRLSATLESEIANKRRLETELNVLKTQMQNANNELERVAKTKSLTESEANKFKEESYKDRNKHDRELTHAKDELQRIFMKLDASERRCDSLESELQAANIALTEKSGHIVMSQREMDYKTSLLNQMEEKFRHEKEINQKLASKVDNGSERSSVLQRELDNLKRELETANQRTVDCDKAARDAQSKFEALLTKAKEDFDKERYNLEQRVLQLSESALRYKEERAEDKEEVKSRDNEIKVIQKELNDLAKTLSAAEAAKEIQMKNGERLEQDNSKLSKQNAVLEKELREVTSLKNELTGKVEDLNEQLEHMLKVSDHTNNKLIQRDNDVQNAKLSRAELEKNITRLKVEKAELVSELREEQAKSQLILDDLRKSNDARESLEKILSNLKTTNVHLEEKLQSETITRAQHERDAEDHKDLWNSEVKSRSRLGLKLVTMEKEIHKLNEKLDDEKRKTIQVEELKRTLESKLEDYDKRTLQHQRESSALKTKLKQYQRRIKDFENGERRIPKIYSEFEREKDVMLNNSANLRRQVDSLIEQLRQEQDYRSKAETNSKRNEQELVDLRAKEKILSFENSKLGRENEMLEEELDKLKNFYERNYVDKSSLDSFKRDIETKARLEINRKLQDVNTQLEEQAAAREAYDQLRSETESKCKKELESTINDLKKELSFVKSALQEGIIKNSTYETEAKRARELYQQEIAEKQKLSEVVEKMNSRSLRLGLESPRKYYTKELRDMPYKNGGSMYLSAERDEHPSKPASHPSELPNRTTSNSFSTPALRGGVTRDFLPAYRHNYFT